MSDRERTHAAAAESVCGTIMLILGVLLDTLGGLASWIGLALLILGIGGLGHGVLLGLGLAGLLQGYRHGDDKTR